MFEPNIVCPLQHIPVGIRRSCHRQAFCTFPKHPIVPLVLKQALASDTLSASSSASSLMEGSNVNLGISVKGELLPGDAWPGLAAGDIHGEKAGDLLGLAEFAKN